MPIHIADAFKTSAFASQQTGLLFNLPLPDPNWAQKQPGVSLCMIVKNEERFLESCLESVKDYVDEINIVDTGSTDRTLEIARRYTDRIEQREWRGDFAWARNEALEMATKRWILVLDADEELTSDSGPLLHALGSTPAETTPVYLKILNRVDDQSGGGTMTHLLPRIYPNTTRVRYHGVIHENIRRTDSEEDVGGVLSPIKIIHKGYTEAIIAGRNKSERNIPLLAKAIEENGESSFSWFNYAMSAIGAEEADTGIEAFEKMFAIDEKIGIIRSYHSLAYLALATAYAYKKNDVDKALDIIDTCLKLDIYSSYTNAHFTRGDILSYAKRYEEARESLLEAIACRASTGSYYMVDDEIYQWKAQYNIAMSYLKENRPTDAAEWFAKALENKPDSVFIRRQYARALERAGKLFEAELTFRDLFEQRTEDVVVVDYADFLIRRGRNVRALEVIDEALPAAKPEFAVALRIGAAAIAISAGSTDAEPYLRSVLEMAPAHATALQMLEQLYRDRSDTVALAELLTSEMESEPQSAGDFGRRSHRYLERQQYDEAVDFARRGLLLAPQDGVLLYNAAAAEMQLGNKHEAVALLERITAETASVYPTALFLLAELVREEPARALAVLEELSAFSPENVDGLLFRASILEELGRLAEAEKLLRESMKPGAQRVGVALVGLLIQSGRLTEAGTIASEALGKT